MSKSIEHKAEVFAYKILDQNLGVYKTLFYMYNFMLRIFLVYSRKITEPPEQLIKNGKPVFGTFSPAPKRLDIRGVARPFGVLPLPTFITDLRIRSSLLFVFNTDEYIGTIDFFDARLFGHVEVVIWEKPTSRKLAYRSVIGPRKRLIPKQTENGICISFKANRYIRISWDVKRKCISAIFKLKGDSARPTISAAFNATLNEKSGCVSAVLPAPTMRRCRAMWIRSAPFAGSMTLQEPGQKDCKVNHDEKGSTLIESTRAYYKLRTKSISAIAAGTINDKQVSFSIKSTSLRAVNADAYNENVLLCDDQLTPLPPVTMTYPFGIKGKWIIQDTENMIDLSFTPISNHSRTLSIFILRTQSHSIYGTFSGKVQTKDGEFITFKDFPGIVRKQMMRL